MKKLRYSIIAVIALGFTTSCVDLNLNPTSEASTENWYQTAEQITMSLNDLYRTYLYGIENEYWTDRRTDDWGQRDYSYDLPTGSTTSAATTYYNFWYYTYKGISRANRVIESIEKLDNPDDYEAYKAEACFFRAYLYGRLTVCWGDAPFYLTSVDYEDTYDWYRTDKYIIMDQVYEDYDTAIAGLPVDNSGSGVWRVNKGCALALKARYALYMGDYQECLDRCQDVIDLGEYSLYYSSSDPADSYGELARDKTNTNGETIFAIGRSYALVDNAQAIKNWVLRTAGGNAVAQPSWDLLAAYECTDGLTINDSPLWDPHEPFENRDPRCTMTFVEPGTTVYGCEFNPHPSASQVTLDGNLVTNKDTRVNDTYCAYNGCCIRKGAQEEWRTGQYNENPVVICRYADVLLMYAEAKLELGDIDNSVLNAINDIRARAYGVQRSATDSYPAVTTTDQTELRKIIRRERRVELAWEGRRFFDLRRWGLLEKCYSIHRYGFPNSAGITAYADNGYWFWPQTPTLDEDGFADFTTMYNQGYITRYVYHHYDSKVELFPIPDDDILICPNLVQNPGY